MREFGEKHEVAIPIIGPVAIDVMDMVANWHRAVMMLPHCAMKPLPIALKIEAAEVVPESLEGLNGPRYDHWLHCAMVSRLVSASARFQPSLVRIK